MMNMWLSSSQWGKSVSDKVMGTTIGLPYTNPLIGLATELPKGSTFPIHELSEENFKDPEEDGATWGKTPGFLNDCGTVPLLTHTVFSYKLRH